MSTEIFRIQRVNSIEKELRKTVNRHESDVTKYITKSKFFITSSPHRSSIQLIFKCLKVLPSVYLHYFLCFTCCLFLLFTGQSACCSRSAMPSLYEIRGILILKSSIMAGKRLLSNRGTSIWQPVIMVYQKKGAFRTKQILYYNIIFVSRKVTFTFAFLANTVITFTSLVLKGHNVNSSLRN